MRRFAIGVLSLTLAVTSAPAVLAGCADDDPDGSLVAAARASADQTCDAALAGCTTAASHGRYVSCVARAVRDLASGESPSLPTSCKGAVKRCAARSTCGKQARGFVTCYRTDAEGNTRCSLKRDPALCTAPPGGSVCVGQNASCCDPCTP
jgi:hypothetical protein